MSQRKTIVAASMEDDCLVLATAIVEWSDEGELHRIAEPIQMEISDRPVANINLESPGEDDQGDFDNEGTFQRIKDYADAQGSVDAIAISLYGTVDPESQILNLVPNNGPRAGKSYDYTVREIFQAHEAYKTTKILVDNDASAAAMGEFIMGEGEGSKAFAYIWAGLGVNVGLVFKGELWEGRMHPEMGHCLPRRHPDDYLPHEIPGTCAIHHDCIMGLASYRSIMERRALKMHPTKLRQIIAYYYAQLCRNIILAVAPDRIVIGGYLVRNDQFLPGLVDEVTKQLKEMMGIYPRYAPPEGEAGFIRAASAELGRNASVLGMIETARRYLDITHLEGKGKS